MSRHGHFHGKAKEWADFGEGVVGALWCHRQRRRCQCTIERAGVSAKYDLIAWMVDSILG